MPKAELPPLDNFLFRTDCADAPELTVELVRRKILMYGIYAVAIVLDELEAEENFEACAIFRDAIADNIEKLSEDTGLDFPKIDRVSACDVLRVSCEYLSLPFETIKKQAEQYAVKIRCELCI